MSNVPEFDEWFKKTFGRDYHSHSEHDKNLRDAFNAGCQTVIKQIYFSDSKLQSNPFLMEKVN